MTSKELCAHIGATPRQVQWWCEKRLLHPTIVGHSRTFDPEQVLQAALVKELRRKHVPLDRIRRIVASKLKGDFLVMTGAMRLWCGREKLIVCVAEAPGACVVVSLEDLRRANG